MQSLYIRLPWLERKLASRCQAIYEETPPLLVTFLKSAWLIILSQEEYLKIFSTPAVSMEDDAEVLSEKLRNMILALLLSQKINLTLNNRAHLLFFFYTLFLNLLNWISSPWWYRDEIEVRKKSKVWKDEILLIAPLMTQIHNLWPIKQQLPGATSYAFVNDAAQSGLQFWLPVWPFQGFQ